MNQMFLSVATLLLTFNVFAGGNHAHEATYYVGEQSVGIAGDKSECYVEAEFSPKGSQVDLRTLLSDSHGDGDLIGHGPVRAKYSSSQKGYYFSSNEALAPIKELLLVAPTKKSAEEMSLSILHEGHHDDVTCANLTEVDGALLEQIEEMFEHFDDYVEEDDHDDDDDHDHHNN